MPFRLTVGVVDKEDGEIYVEHRFYGETKRDAELTFKQHAEGCQFLTPAIAEGRTVEECEEIPGDEWPEVVEEDEEDLSEGEEDDDKD